MPAASDTASRHSLRPAVHQLAVFLTVANAGSFTAAARLLGTTQPAVSQTIRRLEDIYGGDLFERGRGTPLALTPIGTAILPSTKAVLDIIDQQLDAAVRAAQSQYGHLTLGFDGGLGSGPLRIGIERFTAEAPGVRLRLREDMPTALVEQLMSRSLDIILTTAGLSRNDPRLDQERLWEERLVAAMAPSHPLAQCPKIDWQSLATAPLIVRGTVHEPHIYRRLLACTDACALERAQHAVSNGTLREMIAMGWGASIMMESAATSHPGILFRLIAEDDARLAVHAVWHHDDRNPLRHRLLQILRLAARPAAPRG